MTEAIESTTEYTRAQVAHRKSCAFLKGILCGYADLKGHKYESTKELTEDFRAGFELVGKDRWMNASCVTEAHIFHNRLRHRRPHISEEADGRWMCGWPKKHLADYLGDLAEELEALNE
jgi:hypothetical protein